MKAIKRILPLLFVFGLAGCDNGGSASAPATEKPSEKVTEPAPSATNHVTAKPKLILLTQARIDKYAHAVSITSTIDSKLKATKGTQSQSKNTYGKAEAAFKDDTISITQYEQTEYATVVPTTVSDVVDSKYEYKKDDNGYVAVNYLGLDNRIHSESTSYKWDAQGFANPFATRKNSYFQRNAEASTDTEKVYDRKIKQVTTEDSSLLTKRNAFFGCGITGGTIASFSFTIDATSILSYSATVNYSATKNSVKYTYTFGIEGKVNSIDDAEVAKKFLSVKTGTEDTAFNAARQKLAAGNYTETSEFSVEYSGQAIPLTSVVTNHTAADAKVVISEADEDGSMKEYSSGLFAIENGVWSEIAEIGEKGYYLVGDRDVSIPDYSISSLLFTKSGSTYTLGGSSSVLFDPLEYSIGASFDGISSVMTVSDLVVTISDDTITFKTIGTATLSSTKYPATYTTTFTAIGTTASALNGITYKKTGDDLLRTDILADWKEEGSYKNLVTYLGGEDVLNKVPTYGGKFNIASVYYANSSSASLKAAIYWDVGVNGSFADEATFQNYVNSVSTNYETRLTAAGFTVDADKSVATEEFEKDGKTYVLTVNYGLIYSTSSSGTKSYYFAAMPSVAEKAVTTAGNPPRSVEISRLSSLRF